MPKRRADAHGAVEDNATKSPLLFFLVAAVVKETEGVGLTAAGPVSPA